MRSPEERDQDLGEIGGVFRSPPERDRQILSPAGRDYLDAARIAVVLVRTRGTARVRRPRTADQCAQVLGPGWGRDRLAGALTFG
ncbi:hypothetical protein KIK06_13115 [Nocardiopsis sp. EMB25]|uniref:hypothetical protein n=1 Tax=Nocardiopsis sp. EMB25 TaxID=2835867 RepID=UPI002284F8FA|nr:hypothetical protein [Nocardiopsis sp. EMB25]MCY9784830.1 hypothetical protein [Nocardiopsis sp. EMB25]